MKTITKTKIIPEQHKEITVYISEDGKEFYSQQDCLRHENALCIARHPVFRSKIVNVGLFGNDHCADLYYFSNQEDYDFFIEKMGLKCASKYRTIVNSNFNDVSGGAGWYLYWVESDDYSDNHYIQNCQSYMREIHQDFAEWQADLDRRMIEKERTISNSILT